LVTSGGEGQGHGTSKVQMMCNFFIASSASQKNEVNHKSQQIKQADHTSQHMYGSQITANKITQSQITANKTGSSHITEHIWITDHSK
jgi:hypothetical protein